MNHIYPVADLPSTDGNTRLSTNELAARIDAWPALTTHSASDVVVAAISMTRLVEWCSTPCVHTADAAVPRSGGRPSETELASVVVVSVLALEWRSDLRLHVAIDADLSASMPVMSECRIIGHETGSSRASVVLESSGATAIGFLAELPATIAVGDLIAIPCRGVALLHDLRLHANS